jgi:hypothetical protein
MRSFRFGAGEASWSWAATESGIHDGASAEAAKQALRAPRISRRTERLNEKYSRRVSRDVV